jgi:hypothetical protein
MVSAAAPKAVSAKACAAVEEMDEETRETGGLMVRASGSAPPAFFSGGFHSHYESTDHFHHGRTRSSILSTIVRGLPPLAGCLVG